MLRVRVTHHMEEFRIRAEHLRVCVSSTPRRLSGWGVEINSRRKYFPCDIAAHLPCACDASMLYRQTHANAPRQERGLIIWTCDNNIATVDDDNDVWWKKHAISLGFFVMGLNLAKLKCEFISLCNIFVKFMYLNKNEQHIACRMSTICVNQIHNLHVWWKRSSSLSHNVKYSAYVYRLWCWWWCRVNSSFLAAHHRRHAVSSNPRGL